MLNPFHSSRSGSRSAPHCSSPHCPSLCSPGPLPRCSSYPTSPASAPATYADAQLPLSHLEWQGTVLLKSKLSSKHEKDLFETQINALTEGKTVPLNRDEGKGKVTMHQFHSLNRSFSLNSAISDGNNTNKQTNLSPDSLRNNNLKLKLMEENLSRSRISCTSVSSAALSSLEPTDIGHSQTSYSPVVQALDQSPSVIDNCESGKLKGEPIFPGNAPSAIICKRLLGSTSLNLCGGHQLSPSTIVGVNPKSPCSPSFKICSSSPVDCKLEDKKSLSRPSSLFMDSPIVIGSDETENAHAINETDAMDNNVGMAPHTEELPFMQSYARLTPLTTKLTTHSYTPLPNPTKDMLPLPLGFTDNSLLSPCDKQNRTELSTPLSDHSSLPDEDNEISEAIDDDVAKSGANRKETYKVLPNKERRFMRTADALHKSGLWDVAMRTGSLVRRNRELQRELDKFRVDALIFLKSVIKNPHNRDIIKSVLSNALANSRQDIRHKRFSRGSSLMTVVVSAAAAVASTSRPLDSAGSSDAGSTSGGSLSGNVSDSSGRNSSNQSESSMDGSLFPTYNFGTSKDKPMDIN